MIAIALYQPDIPQNVGAMMRLAVCTGVQLHIIQPCGFPWDERKIRRSGMDYVDQMEYQRHDSWEIFLKNTAGSRLILLTTKADRTYYNFEFQDGDILLLGRESAGVPHAVHDTVHASVTIPMAGKARSLNVVNATAMVLGETLRQVHGY